MLRPAGALLATTALLLGGLTPATAADDVVYSGRVTAEGEAPPRPVQVSWREPATGRTGTTTTSADGTYALPVPTDATAWVLTANTGADDPRTFAPAYVGAGGRTDYAWQGVPLRPAATADATVDIDLDRTGSVGATVAGAESTSAHAWIQRLDGTPIRGQHAKGIEDGKVQFRYLVPGRYRIQAWLKSGVEITSDVVTVRAGERSTTSLPATPPGTVTGRLVGSDAPRPGVEVTLQSADADGRYLRSTTSDATGRYRFTRVPVGTYRLAESADDNGWSSGSALLKVTSGATTTRHLTLTREGTIYVPSADGTVYLADANAKGIRQPLRSRFTVPPGRYYVYSIGDLWIRKPVTVRAGKVTTTGHLRGNRTAVALAGNVTGGDKGTWQDPRREVVVCGVDCVDYTHGAAVGRNGDFVARGLVPGAARVTVRQKGWVSTETDTQIDDGGSRIALRLTERQGSVRVRLYYRGVPFDGNVNLMQHGSVTSSWDHPAHGLYTGAAVDPGTYRLTLSPSIGHTRDDEVPYWYTLPAAYRVITVERGKNLDLGDVELVLNR